MNRNSFGMNKQELIVQMHKYSDDSNPNQNENDDNEPDPFGSSPQSDVIPEDQEVFAQRIDALEK